MLQSSSSTGLRWRGVGPNFGVLSRCAFSPPRGATALGLRRYGGDPYQLLGVTRKSTPTEVKAAFHKKAKEWHPDRNPPEKKAACEAKFKDIQAAYDAIRSGKANQTNNGQGAESRHPGYGQRGPFGNQSYQEYRRHAQQNPYSNPFGSQRDPYTNPYGQGFRAGARPGFGGPFGAPGASGRGPFGSGVIMMDPEQRKRMQMQRMHEMQMQGGYSGYPPPPGGFVPPQGTYPGYPGPPLLPPNPDGSEAYALGGHPGFYALPPRRRNPSHIDLGYADHYKYQAGPQPGDPGASQPPGPAPPQGGGLSPQPYGGPPGGYPMGRWSPEQGWVEHQPPRTYAQDPLTVEQKASNEENGAQDFIAKVTSTSEREIPCINSPPNFSIPDEQAPWEPPFVPGPSESGRAQGHSTTLAPGAPQFPRPSPVGPNHSRQFPGSQPYGSFNFSPEQIPFNLSEEESPKLPVDGGQISETPSHGEDPPFAPSSRRGYPPPGPGWSNQDVDIKQQVPHPANAGRVKGEKHTWAS